MNAGLIYTLPRLRPYLVEGHRLPGVQCLVSFNRTTSLLDTAALSSAKKHFCLRKYSLNAAIIQRWELVSHTLDYVLQG